MTNQTNKIDPNHPSKNKNLEPVPKNEPVPYPSEHGWYRTKGHPNTRIEGSAQVCGDAKVYDSAWVFGSAQVCGGKLIGRALYASALRYNLSLQSPGVVSIGCETHLIKDWIKPGKSKVPWEQYHITPAQRRAIVALIKAIQMQEKLGETWDRKGAGKGDKK